LSSLNDELNIATIPRAFSRYTSPYDRISSPSFSSVRTGHHATFPRTTRTVATTVHTITGRFSLYCDQNNLWYGSAACRVWARARGPQPVSNVSGNCRLCLRSVPRHFRTSSKHILYCAFRHQSRIHRCHPSGYHCTLYESFPTCDGHAIQAGE